MAEMTNDTPAATRAPSEELAAELDGVRTTFEQMWEQPENRRCKPYANSLGAHAKAAIEEAILALGKAAAALRERVPTQDVPRCRGCGHPPHARGQCARTVGREMYAEACACALDAHVLAARAPSDTERLATARAAIVAERDRLETHPNASGGPAMAHYGGAFAGLRFALAAIDAAMRADTPSAAPQQQDGAAAPTRAEILAALFEAWQNSTGLTHVPNGALNAMVNAMLVLLANARHARAALSGAAAQQAPTNPTQISRSLVAAQQAEPRTQEWRAEYERLLRIQTHETMAASTTGRFYAGKLKGLEVARTLMEIADRNVAPAPTKETT